MKTTVERMIGSLIGGIGVAIIVWKTGSGWIPIGISIMMLGKEITNVNKK